MNNKLDSSNSTNNQDESPFKELGLDNDCDNVNNEVVDNNEYPEDYIEDVGNSSSYGQYQKSKTDEILVLVCLTLIFLLCTVFSLWKLNDFRSRYEEISATYREWQDFYNEVIQHKELKHWFTLLRNPNKSEIVIADTSGFDIHGNNRYAKMFADGKIEGYIDGQLNISIDREPYSRQEVELFFGENDSIDSDWLWMYYEFYRDFVKNHKER